MNCYNCGHSAPNGGVCGICGVLIASPAPEVEIGVENV